MRKLVFPAFCLVLSGCTQTSAPATESMSMFKPLMFHNTVRVGEEDPYLEGKQKLRHDYMTVLMDSYAAYMIVRYAELNDALPADQRARARSIVALIASHADGEFGHRDTGLSELEGYTVQALDSDRILQQGQGS